MTTKKALSSCSALSASSVPFISTAEAQALFSAVFYDAEKGTFLRGVHVFNAFRAHGVSVDAFRAWCAERWLQRVDTSYQHAVRLAAAVAYRIDFFEMRDIYETELHAVNDIADALYQAGKDSSAIYEYVADQYGEQDDGDETVKLVQLMNEMRVFIKARAFQKRTVK